MMSCHANGVVKCAPLLIFDFPLVMVRHFEEAEKLNLQFTDPSEITEMADKLRWYRCRKALLQRDVADYAGIDRSTYIHYEEPGRDYYPLNKLTKVAEILEVNVTELLDEYNLFLYHDQGRQIREKREALGMTIIQYAEYLGIQPGKLRRWESNQVHILKNTWERYFK